MAGSINTGLLSSQGVAGVANDLLDSAVGGLSPLNNFGRYLTGSRAVIKINDKLFGFAFGVTFNINTSVDEIWTVDDWTPFELAPNKISVEGTLSMFHVPGKSPTRQLVQANVLSFLFHKHITIHIEDQTTGQTIFTTEKAVITSRKQSLRAGELSTIELTWKSVGWVDDITPSYPVGHDSNAEAGETASQSLLGAISDGINNLF